MKVFFVLFGLFSLGSCSIILPEDLTSALDLAYGYIPPIKKGTDSRVGFGFAYGNHVDAKVMFEMGPQKNTLALNGQGFKSDGTKRQVPTLQQKTINKNGEKTTKVWKPPTLIQSPGEVPKLEDSIVELVKNRNGVYKIRQPASPLMSQAILDSLRTLYGQKKDESKNSMEKKKENKREVSLE